MHFNNSSTKTNWWTRIISQVKHLKISIKEGSFTQGGGLRVTLVWLVEKIFGELLGPSAADVWPWWRSFPVLTAAAGLGPRIQDGGHWVGRGSVYLEVFNGLFAEGHRLGTKLNMLWIYLSRYDTCEVDVRLFSPGQRYLLDVGREKVAKLRPIPGLQRCPRICREMVSAAG